MAGHNGQSVLIVGGGALGDPKRLQAWAQRYSTIVAADAGLGHTIAAELRADVVIGDLDSVSAAVLATMPPERVIRADSQEDTDLEKAIRWAISNQNRVIGLACVSGDRIDHTFNAVSLMLRYKSEAEFILHDERGDARLCVAPEATIEGQIGQKVSLIPAPAAHGLHSKGLRYALKGVDLVLGGKDGISNELTALTAEIQLTSGSFLAYLQAR